MHTYPCPNCRSTSSLHDHECRFDGRSRATVEKAYTDILAVLADGPRTPDALKDDTHGRWSVLHAAVLEELKNDYRVRTTDDGVLVHLTPEERHSHVTEPTREPIRTVYKKGSVPGCHDNAVFALVSYYEMVGLSWAETRSRVIDWLRESGAWERGGFEESSPEAVVDAKRHVHEKGYGWKEKAESARRTIERRLEEVMRRGVDASSS